MAKNLVVVESPAKARTIERYLGGDYKVLASYGHVRDLPENPGKGKFGVDVDHDFAPEYVISEDRKKYVDAILAAEDGTTFPADVVRIDGKPIEIGDGETAERHALALRRRTPIVKAVTKRPLKRSPAPPFTTSTLQQEASRKLSFAPKRTMSVAQRLYEGADTPDGHVGLITYMRTDSTAIAGVAMGEARDVIRARFGQPYTMPKGRVYKTKAKGAQEAHESIRPTAFRRDPDSLAGTLASDELRLYRLIWQRAIASQMAAKELETTTVELADGPYELRASATKTLFDGFAAVY